MASTSSHQIPSSSTAPPPPLWDVFLSFRGLDTRYIFTEHLYNALHSAGIRTFMDNQLRSGEVIADSLIQAIQHSKTYIVVLSENYASSSWCLDELVEILSCYKTMKRLVVPVFYNIEPTVVRHQKKDWMHQTRYETEKVNKWRLSLKEVADLSGYPVSKNSSQVNSIKEVVHRILLEINPMTLDVPKYLVGLDSRVKGVTALFNSDTKGVIRIGIYGMGGVGKTTLAKAVYNQNYQRFQGSCFLENVREVSKTEQGLVRLQKQLIVDVIKLDKIEIDNVGKGIQLIRARIGSRKVLIVIDDLDDPKQLEYLEGSFASGSVVIITTRNEGLLDRINVKARYKVEELDITESHKLFTQHAFGDNPVTFPELSKVILKRAGGLPLALEVFGSNLLNESEKVWIWFIDKLNRVPIDDIEKNLMISYDALKSVDPILQDIFLDIACFYIGREKEEAVRIMETCYTCVDQNIDNLMKRCLITINEWGGLGMHDLLRDMGRKIARNDSPDEPERHSRLWVSEDIDSVMKNQQGTEAIQGIISAGFKTLSWFEFNNGVKEVTCAAEHFKKMSKLRFLYLDSVNLTGSFEQTFKDLRWLRWVHCPLECLPSEFHPQKLVILELPYSKMRIWELNLNMDFEKLKTLDMRNSEYLTTTPDFTTLSCLQTLNLSFCRSLKEVHISIGSLRALEFLDISGCEKLEELPDQLGNIESLKELRTSFISVSKLPDSIGRLSNLVKLYLCNNTNLKTLPDSICNLRSLEVLDISECEKLEDLPDQLGNIESLKVLEASRTSVSKLPDSIGRLSNLVELNLCHNRNLKTLPDSICNLRSLEVLDIRKCENLEELPDQLGKITSLRELRALDATKLKMIPDISRLSNLEDLNLHSCHSLVSIAELPPNLKKLKAGDCQSLKRFPNLSHLKHLEELDLHNCRSLTGIHGFEELTCLKRLVIAGCGSLEGILDVSNLKLSEKLNLADCTGFTKIQGYRKLTSLRTIHLNDCNSSLVASILTKSCLEMWRDRGSVSSILPIRDHSHNNIEIGFHHEIPCGIHLVYKTGITTIFDNACTVVNVEDERSNPLLDDFESNASWLSLRSNSDDVEEERSNPLLDDFERLSLRSNSDNVEEERSNPLLDDFKTLPNASKRWLSLRSNSENVEEERSHPSKRLKHSECDSWLSL